MAVITKLCEGGLLSDIACVILCERLLSCWKRNPLSQTAPTVVMKVTPMICHGSRSAQRELTCRRPSSRYSRIISLYTSKALCTQRHVAGYRRLGLGFFEPKKSADVTNLFARDNFNKGKGPLHAWRLWLWVIVWHHRDHLILTLGNHLISPVFIEKLLWWDTWRNLHFICFLVQIYRNNPEIEQAVNHVLQ